MKTSARKELEHYFAGLDELVEKKNGGVLMGVAYRARYNEIRAAMVKHNANAGLALDLANTALSSIIDRVLPTKSEDQLEWMKAFRSDNLRDLAAQIADVIDAIYIPQLPEATTEGLKVVELKPPTHASAETLVQQISRAQDRSGSMSREVIEEEAREARRPEVRAAQEQLRTLEATWAMNKPSAEWKPKAGDVLTTIDHINESRKHGTMVTMTDGQARPLERELGTSHSYDQNDAD